MKRRTLKFIACAAVMALTLSVTACGGSDNSSNSNTSVAENTKDVKEDVSAPEADEEKEEEVNTAEEEETKVPEAEEETEDEAGSESEDGEYFETLEEAFADPEVKAAWDEEINSMDIDGMEISYEVTGNDFIVNYKVIDTVIDDPADFAEQMEPVMEQLGSVFSLVAEVFDEAIGKEGATTVVVRFLDASDTLLIEHSYKAE